jgi:hypothetical protein
MSTDFSGTEHAKRWRHMEAEARLMALSMSDREAKRTMLFIADGYRRLAERAETLTAPGLLDGAAFGPHALKAIGEAFDAAWAEIASNFGDDAVEIRAMRLKLATALLSVASEDSRDVQVLKNAALQIMAIDYHKR